MGDGILKARELIDSLVIFLESTAQLPAIILKIIVKCVEPGGYLGFNRLSMKVLFILCEDELFIQPQQC